MLHYETIDPETLELLKILQSIPYFETVRLVGETSLALQIGHRKSIDLDLFGEFIPEGIAISKALKDVGEVELL